jgi:plasmid stabilization system protein ParE
MPAIETFDWFKKQVWDQLSEDARRDFEAQRGYLLEIRNEDERRRFVDDLMKEVKHSMKRK